MGQRKLGDDKAKRFIGSSNAGEWLYNKDVDGKDILIRSVKYRTKRFKGEDKEEFLCEASVDGIDCIVCLHGDVIVRDLKDYVEGKGEFPIVATVHKPDKCWCFADPDKE